jgi:hypothetical protein
MSNKNLATLCTALVALTLSLTVAVPPAQAQEDRILTFYTSSSAKVMSAVDSLLASSRYSFDVFCRHEQLERGKVVQSDTLIARYYFTGFQLDSQIVDIKTANRFDDLDFFAPNVMDMDYAFSFFPNDTGGVDLAIGFDTDSLNDPRPVGLAIINRDFHYPHRLHLSYPSESTRENFSQTFSFTLQAGSFVFPDTITDHVSEIGVLFPEHHRRITTIDNFRIDW